MKRTLLLFPAVAILLLTSSPALAQSVLFEDDFEAGLGLWTVEAPWHLEAANDPCASLSNVPAGYGTIARVGDLDCTYNSVCPTMFCFGASAGMSTTDSFLIPADAVNPRLEFDSCLASNDCGFDHGTVDLIIGGNTVPGLLIVDCSPVPSWHHNSLDLSPWIGQRIRLQFMLRLLDEQFNDGLGWLIDNVRVTADCASQNYCVAAANSASPTGAIIGHTGSLQLAQNNFALTLEDGPPGQFALFFYGPFQQQVPVTQGYLCIGPDQFGFRRLVPAGQIDSNGDLGYPLDFTALNGSHTVLPGIGVNFQCWYRDVVNGTSTTNFSNAQSITFCP